VTVYELVQKGDVEALKSRVLVEGEIDRVNDATGYTPMCVAVHMRRADLVRVLLERGASPDSGEAFATPLCDGAGDTEIVKLLLKHKAKVDAQDEDGGTALMGAAAAGNLETVKLLLKAGADPRMHDKYGMGALLQAADKGHTAVVELLRPLSSRVDRKRIAMLALAREERFPFEKVREVTDAINSKKPATVKRLMNAGVPVDARNPNGMTPLMTAANRGDMRIVKFLLKKGADPTLEDVYAGSPVVYAAMGGSRKAYELLFPMATATQRKKAAKMVEQSRLYDRQFKNWPRLGVRQMSLLRRSDHPARISSSPLRSPPHRPGHVRGHGAWQHSSEVCSR